MKKLVFLIALLATLSAYADNKNLKDYRIHKWSKDYYLILKKGVSSFKGGLELDSGFKLWQEEHLSSDTVIGNAMGIDRGIDSSLALTAFLNKGKYIPDTINGWTATYGSIPLDHLGFLCIKKDDYYEVFYDTVSHCIKYGSKYHIFTENTSCTGGDALIQTLSLSCILGLLYIFSTWIVMFFYLLISGGSYADLIIDKVVKNSFITAIIGLALSIVVNFGIVPSVYALIACSILSWITYMATKSKQPVLAS